MGEATAVRAGLTTATLLLTYPHLVSGTLPLNRRARPFFPKGHGERTMVTLIDGRWGNRFPAWANHAGRYIAGLRPWFEKHKLPAGAYITLERRDDSGEIVVDFRPKRMRREWTALGAGARGQPAGHPAPQARGRLRIRRADDHRRRPQREILKLRASAGFRPGVPERPGLRDLHRPGRLEPDRQRSRQDDLQRRERAAPLPAGIVFAALMTHFAGTPADRQLMA